MTRLGTPFANRVTTRRGTLIPGLLLIVAYAVLAVLGAPMANSSFVAKITNSADTAAPTGYSTCTSAATGSNAYFAYPLNEATGTTVADVTRNNRSGTYGGDVTFGAPGPCRRDSGKAATLNGSTGYITGPTKSAVIDPQIFSMEIWFKTTVGGGKLIGFGSASSGSSPNNDRHLYLTNGGNVVFGVYPNAVQVVQSTASYTDGQWHQAVATLAPSSDANPGIRLYVDGALVAANVNVVTAQDYSGYWRIGYDNLNGWGNTQPTNFCYKGSLAYASVYTSALTPAAVAAHYRAGI